LKNGPSPCRTVGASPSWHWGVGGRLCARANWRRSPTTAMPARPRELRSIPRREANIGRLLTSGPIPKFANQIAARRARTSGSRHWRSRAGRLRPPHPHQHVLDRMLGGGELFRVAGAQHDIGVGTALRIEEWITADRHLRIGLGDLAEL